ncbi:MAG TPA: hypothetical protein VHY09_01360 [Candidatus Methylacidiphilales bacterium]|jgi:hypothetical protein|nr:hypothetical protein [Candidatus Methylacidiphilales bacterium]
MIIDRKHVGWGIGTAIASFVVAILYLANTNPAALEKHGIHLALPAWFGPSPPLAANEGVTPLGLIYGTAALLIFIFAALLGSRRNHPGWPLGKIQSWLRAHIWLTIFTIPLVAFHCGFHGGGPMTQFLLWLYAFVMVSGFWGLFLQNVIPKLMREQLPQEVIFEQIPFVRGQLIAQAETIRDDLARELQAPEVVEDAHGGNGGVATLAPAAVTAVIRFTEQEVLPYLRTAAPRRSALRTREASDGQFRLLRLQLPEALHAPLRDLQDLCDEKRRLGLQTRLHHWLHGWLIFHAPASLLLVVLTIVHAIVAGFLYT